MALLEAKNLKKSFGNLEILKGVDVKIENGEMVAIVGPSGAGKTTLLQILGTLEKPDEGELFYSGKAIHHASKKDLNQLRNEELGFIFQFHNLLAELTALENVMLPNWIGKRKETSRATEILETLGMGKRLEHLPSQLSGGEQQRVAVARALVNGAKLIFADEPTGNLDSKNAEELHHLFNEIRNNYGCSFVIVTHNDALAQQADRVLTLKDGVLM